jgi:hypothetical protein
MSETAHCRSCGADIIWAVTEKGKAMPVDPTPLPDGNIVLSMRTNQAPVAAIQTKESIEYLLAQAKYTGQEHLLFKSHFATCPNATKHRKAR